MQFILIFLASLLGSIHCAAMCGGFSAICSNQTNPVKSQIFYNSGRLLAYLILGLVAMQIGQIINSLGTNYGIYHLASYLTGSLLILAGLAALLSYRLNYLKLIPYKLLLPLKQKLCFLKKYGLLFPLMLGFFSSFLPCGWLYSYLAVASNAQSILTASAIMFFFWLGTLPILISIAGVSRIVTSPLKKFAPMMISIMMILAGVFSFTEHLKATPNPSTMVSEHCSKHH